MPLVTLSTGQNIFYLDNNSSGDSLVLLLHGLGVNGSSWQFQIPALIESGYSPLAPDIPGFGKSQPVRGTLSIAKIAADMAEFMGHFSKNPFAVVGISMGGVIALQLALDFPKLVGRLVLVNTFAHLRLYTWQTFPYFALRAFLVYTLGLPRQSRTVARRIFPRPEQEPFRQSFMEQINQADPRGYRAMMRCLATFDARKRLEVINCPTLIVTGAQDTTVAPENQIELAKGIHHAEHIIIPHAGHAVTIEKPDQINELLVGFLTQRPEQSKK